MKKTILKILIMSLMISAAIFGINKSDNSGLGIINGHDALIGSRPYYISLGRNKKAFNENKPTYRWCGASLIAPNWALSCGHGNYDFKIANSLDGLSLNFNYYDSTGEKSSNFNPNKLNPDYEERDSDNIVFDHFNSGLSRKNTYASSNSIQNDISLIHFKNPITNIKPITLDNSIPIANDKITVTGYGALMHGMPIKLQTTDSIVNDWEKVFNLPQFKDNENDFSFMTEFIGCYDPEHMQTQDSVGDSGGPVVVNNTLAGIVSRGVLDDFDARQPCIYTAVAAYLNWIQDTVENMYPNEHNTIKIAK